MRYTSRPTFHEERSPIAINEFDWPGVRRHDNYSRQAYFKHYIRQTWPSKQQPAVRYSWPFPIEAAAWDDDCGNTSFVRGWYLRMGLLFGMLDVNQRLILLYRAVEGGRIDRRSQHYIFISILTPLNGPLYNYADEAFEALAKQHETRRRNERAMSCHATNIRVLEWSFQRLWMAAFDILAHDYFDGWWQACRWIGVYIGARRHIVSGMPDTYEHARFGQAFTISAGMSANRKDDITSKYLFHKECRQWKRYYYRRYTKK